MAPFHLRLLLLSALVLPPRLSAVAMQATVKGLERSPGVLLAQAPLLAGPAIPVKVEVWVDGAITAYKRRDTATALRLQKQVVAWLKANRPRLDEFRAISLLRLGVLLSEEGKSQEALVHTEEAVNLYRELAKTNQSFLNDLAGSLNNLGVQCSQYGRRHEALVATEEAVKIRRELVKSNPAFLVDLASSLNNLGIRYNELGRRQEALSPSEEAVKIYREQVRTNQALKGDLAHALTNLGVLYTDMGRHQEALAPTEEAVKIYRDQVRTNQAFKGELARSLTNLGARYIELGRRQEALAPTEEAVKIRRELSKSNSVYLGELASSLSNLGIIYSDLGRNQEALAPTEEAVKIHRELAKTNPAFLGGLANSLTLLGSHYSELGRRQEALPPSEEAVKIYRQQAKTNPAFQGDLAVSLNNLGNRYNELGRRQEALAPTEEAVKIRRNLAETNPGFLVDLASSLNNLGATYSTMARRQEALSPTEEAVKIYREQSKTNPAFKTAFAHSATNLAILKLQLANLSAALPLLRESVIMDMSYLQGQLPLLPEGRRLALVELFNSRWQIPFSHAQQGEEGASLAMFTRLNRQGLLQAIQRSQALLARSGPQRPLFEQLSAVMAQLANTTLTPQQQAPLLARKEQLEQELYRQLPQIHPKLVEPRQVAAVLPAGGLLVEFQRYYPHDPSKNWEQGFESPRYLALLLRPDGTIRAIPLGEAALIDTAVRAAVAASADANQQTNAAKKLAAVSRLVLEPLKRELMGVRELFISPDGELNRLPFAALPVAAAKADGLADGLITPDGPTLGDAVALRLLTTGRDLLWLQQPTMAGGAPVLIANPDFNNAHPGPAAPITAAFRTSAAGTPTAANVAGSNVLLRGQQRSPGVRDLIPWLQLAGTAQETRQLAPLLGGRSVISGAAATSAVVLALRAPQILHIATHGFFLADQDSASSTAPSAPSREDPLQRSGLVFAGANQPDANPSDDGYLTAAEATTMDLEGTELVTLSACDTGLGGLQSGEGVYGLQRALAVAGARSTLLSLWKVDDGLTAAFMESYYKRLKVGEGRADALRNTQSEFRNHKNSTYNDIRVWGAFQLSGDWRPMQRWRSTRLTLVDAPHSLLFRLIFLSLLLIVWLRRPHQAARTLKGVVLVLPLMLSACANTRLNDGAAVNDAKSLLLQAWAADPVTASLPFPKIRLLSQDTSVDQACAHEGPPRRPAPLASYCAPNNEVLVDQDLLVSATQEAAPAKARTVAAYWIATALAERLLAAVGADPLPNPVSTLQANCLSGNLLGAKPTLFSPPETKGLFDTARAAYGDSARAVVGSPSQRGYALLSGLGATASSCSSTDMVALVNGTVPDSGILRKIEQLPPPSRGYSSMMDAINSQCQPLPNRPCPRRLAPSKPQP